MKRVKNTPRANWEKKILEQGLLYDAWEDENGHTQHYWNEKAHYEISVDEALELEDATRNVHQMFLAAMETICSGKEGTLGFSDEAFEFAVNSYKAHELSLYGRFDFIYDGFSSPKLLEYNADTPTALIETALIQKCWQEELYPDDIQFNILHDELVKRWKYLKKKLNAPEHELLYFAHADDEPTGEDWTNTAFLKTCAGEAGWDTIGINMQRLTWNEEKTVFVDGVNSPITHIFKLYPWEDMMDEPGAEHILRYPKSTHWFEPAWKMLLSDKKILSVLWKLYPDSPYLLPTYTDSPHNLREYVKKPVYGREGKSISIHTPNKKIVSPYTYHDVQDDEYIYQELFRAPNFKSRGQDNHLVIGSWVVGNRPAGLAFRESNSLITDEDARFVPHIVKTKQSDFIDSSTHVNTATIKA